MTQQPFSRLPESVRPVKYLLSYTSVDLEREKFEGEEKIIVDIKEVTNSIVCHAADLWVSKVAVLIGKESIACNIISYNAQEQTVTFRFDQDVPVCKKAILSMSFRGILNDELRGFYRSQYFVNGEKRTMAVTQFEACDARRAFVCWDEPAVKATFEMSVTAKAHLNVISNTEVVSTHVENGKKTWKFAESPVMSTYLLAIVVGEFDSISAFTKEGVHVSIYTPLGKSSQGKFALHVATKALSFYTSIYGIAYPLRKLDMLAIPDFAAGAMENWGCVTYRETRLLIDEKKSSVAMKTAAARTICHELAHMWYGNYVTMEWWTSLWLNEGFARYMEFEAVNYIFPEWNVWEKFVQEIVVGVAMQKDSMMTSHPIEVEVGHPDEVNQIFDVISYAKGASVIRMLSFVLGRENFYKGIHQYLTKFQYANAKTKELWEALESASDMKITTMMDSWTLQTGFPVLSLSEENGKLKIKQKRFLNNGNSTDKTRWDVPLFISSESNKDPQLLEIVTRSIDSFECKVPSGSWFLLNPEQMGFYIVNYTKSQWNTLAKAVALQQINTINRMVLLSSVFRLANAGEISLSDALTFTLAYKNEKEYTVWKELSENLSFYCKLFAEKEYQPKLRAFVAGIAQDFADYLTWDSKDTDTETTSLLRRSVISLLVAAKQDAAVKEAIARFDDYIVDPENSLLAPDLRALVFKVAARHGGEKVMQYLKNFYAKSDLNEEKIDCLTAIGHTSNEKHKLQVITWSIENVRSQDIQYVFAGVAADVTGSELTWKFVRDHWDELNKKYSAAVVGRIVCAAIHSYKSNAKAAEIEKFFANHQHNAYERPLAASLESIRTKALCLERCDDDVEAWLESQ